MKIRQRVLGISLAALGGLVALYCGIGSLFILGDKDPQFHLMGYGFVGIALTGFFLVVLGIKLAMRP